LKPLSVVVLFLNEPLYIVFNEIFATEPYKSHRAQKSVKKWNWGGIEKVINTLKYHHQKKPEK
jgi:hypothetical protein